MKNEITIYDLIEELEDKKVDFISPIKIENNEEMNNLYLYLIQKFYIVSKKSDFLKLMYQEESFFYDSANVLMILINDINFAVVFKDELRQALNDFVTINRGLYPNNKDNGKWNTINEIIGMFNEINLNYYFNKCEVVQECFINFVTGEILDRISKKREMKIAVKAAYKYEKMLENDVKVFILYYLKDEAFGDILQKKSIISSAQIHLNKIQTLQEKETNLKKELTK